MAYSTRTIGIAIASVIAAGLMLAAFLLSGPLPFHIRTVNAESTHDLLVSYAAKDSDNDGLPDWEEALYGTDPHNPHSVSPTLTDGQAVAQGLVKPKFATATSTPVDTSSIPGVKAAPSTLTDQFARQLFSQYLSQRGGTPPTPDQVATFVEQGVASLQQSQSVQDAYSARDMNVSGSGPDALLSYAAAMDAILAKYSPQLPQSELDYFSDAVERGQTGELKQVAAIGSAYTAIAKSYVGTPVPHEAAAAHLALANALARLGTDITDMAAIDKDPLRGYMGLASYQVDAPHFISALAGLDSVFVAEGVQIPAGTSGSGFYNALVRAASNASSTAP